MLFWRFETNLVVYSYTDYLSKYVFLQITTWIFYTHRYSNYGNLNIICKFALDKATLCLVYTSRYLISFIQAREVATVGTAGEL